LLSIADEEQPACGALIEATWGAAFRHFAIPRVIWNSSSKSQRATPALGRRIEARLLLTRQRCVSKPRRLIITFEPAPGQRATDLHGLFLQLSCLLGGLAAQAHLLENDIHVTVATQTMAAAGRVN